MAVKEVIRVPAMKGKEENTPLEGAHLLPATKLRPLAPNAGIERIKRVRKKPPSISSTSVPAPSTKSENNRSFNL